MKVTINPPVQILLLPSLFYGILAIFCLWFGFKHDSYSLPIRGLFLSFGIVIWTFIEYLTHRFLSHLQIFSKWHDHSIHHKDPNNPNEIVFRIRDSFLPALIIFALIYLCSESINVSLAIFSGALIAYIIHEWIHFGSHFWKAKTRLGKFLYETHHRHHFKNPNKDFGISNPLWDFIFGTLSRKH